MLEKYGIGIQRRAPKAPPGIDTTSFNRALDEHGLWDDWKKWCGSGITMSVNGIYPWDVEDFLAGRPNND